MPYSVLERLLRWLIVTCCLAAAVAGINVVFSQTYVQGYCPSPANESVWESHSTVYVTIDNSLNDAQRNQIIQAISEWNHANASYNTSGVQFVIGDPPAGGGNTLHITQGTVYVDNSTNPPTYNTTGSGDVATGIAAYTHRDNNDSAGNLTSATIALNTGGALSLPTYPNSGPFYDPTKPGYDSVFLKAILHEIGHTMGMADAPGKPNQTQPPQNSVMNLFVGGCPNDYCTIQNQPGGNLPKTVTQCDNDAVNDVPSYGEIASGGGGQDPPYWNPDPDTSSSGGGYCYHEYSCHDYYTCTGDKDQMDCEYAGTDCYEEVGSTCN